ncbi:hypothetical protein VULLAG_LOCUS13355 [Vulpes lagopus]
MGGAGGRGGRGAARGARSARRCRPEPGPPVPPPPPPPCVPLGGGAGLALSPPSSPPPFAGRTRLPRPLGPRVIARPEHGESLREPAGALPARSAGPAGGPEASVRPGRVAGMGEGRAAWGAWMNEALSD